VGWGSTEPTGGGSPAVTLQELDSVVLPNSDCAAGGIGAGEICVDSPNGNSGICIGDSGGPALQRGTFNIWQAVGSVSRGLATATACGDKPIIFTDLTYYRPWLAQVILTGQVPPPGLP
jgi:secreted trypsin-like serine protease